MMLIFLKPVESSSDLIFISILFEISIEMLPVLPLPGPPKTVPWNMLYSTIDTLPSLSVF